MKIVPRRTLSESLFEEFCAKFKIKCQRVETSNIEGEKRPDYNVFLNGTRIVVEVKQMDPNPDESSKHEELDKKGVVTIKSKLGHRVRGKI